MELLIWLVFIWCYIVGGFVVVAVVSAGIEPFDTGDIGDALLLTLLFWPIIVVRMIARRRWRFSRVDAALEETQRRAKQRAQSFCPECVREEGQRHEVHCPYYESGMPDDIRLRNHVRRKNLEKDSQ